MTGRRRKAREEHMKKKFDRLSPEKRHAVVEAMLGTFIVQGAHVAGISTQPETLGAPIGLKLTAKERAVFAAQALKSAESSAVRSETERMHQEIFDLAIELAHNVEREPELLTKLRLAVALLEEHEAKILRSLPDDAVRAFQRKFSPPKR